MRVLKALLWCRTVLGVLSELQYTPSSISDGGSRVKGGPASAPSLESSVKYSADLSTLLPCDSLVIFSYPKADTPGVLLHVSSSVEVLQLTLRGPLSPEQAARHKPVASETTTKRSPSSTTKSSVSLE